MKTIWLTLKSNKEVMVPSLLLQITHGDFHKLLDFINKFPYEDIRISDIEEI